MYTEEGEGSYQLFLFCNFLRVETTYPSPNLMYYEEIQLP